MQWGKHFTDGFFPFFPSDVLLWLGEYTEEGIKAEEGASNKEQGESAEPEKELSASANDPEVPMEVGIGMLVCLMQFQVSLVREILLMF